MNKISVLLVTGFLASSCGETVNYDVEEKPLNAANTIDSPSDDASSAGTIGSDGTENTLALCQAASIQSQDVRLIFPELPAGTTCKFAESDNLSRKDRFFRAYLRQTQKVDLPEGATLCGLSLEHQAEGMRYDDEMFFLLNERILLATKDYTAHFSYKDDFHVFSWGSLVDQAYDPLAATIPYCAGASDGLSDCSVPPTETQGKIELIFNEDMNQRLAKSLESERSLSFDWITTGDNDSTDCRHSEIVLDLKIEYALPSL